VNKLQGGKKGAGSEGRKKVYLSGGKKKKGCPRKKRGGGSTRISKETPYSHIPAGKRVEEKEDDSQAFEGQGSR